MDTVAILDELVTLLVRALPSLSSGTLALLLDHADREKQRRLAADVAHGAAQSAVDAALAHSIASPLAPSHQNETP